jgi:hypothetical protein
VARSSQGAPLSCDIAANAAVEQLNGMLRYAIGLEFGEDAPGISWSEAAARRIGGEELKRWPALVRIWAFSDFEITLKSSLRLKKMRTLRWHHSMNSADGHGAERQLVRGNAGNVM